MKLHDCKFVKHDNTTCICVICGLKIPTKFSCDKVYNNAKTASEDVTNEPKFFGRLIDQNTKKAGTHLHNLIKKYLQEDYSEGCGCESMVRKMNAWGPDGCREHLDEIVDKMTEAAKSRGWKKRLLASVPFVSRAGMKAMVLMAIRLAEKEATTEQSSVDQPPQILHARPSDAEQG